MKIIAVIVDELPENCLNCEVLLIPSYALRRHNGICEFTREYVCGSAVRPSDCPLRLEHDNKKIANEVM